MIVPLNQRLAFGELIGIVSRVEPRAIFHDATFAELARSLADAVRSAPPSLSARAPDSPTTTCWARPRPAATVPARSRTDAATICFTGGTTGLPKGCVLSHGALVENGRVVPVTHGLRAGDRHAFVRPMAVAPGHRMTAWHGYLGGTTVIAERFEPAAFYRLVEDQRINVTLLSPTMFQMLLDDGNPAGHDVSSLRSVAYGGAPITPDLLARVLEVFGCELHQNYGGTEAAIATHLTPADHLAGLLDSVGRAAPGVDIRIVDEAGADQPVGTPGEVLVRSDQLFSEYWNDPATTADALRDGYYWTGDVGVRDDDGYVRIVGRTKDLIISGGFNVYPIEVENVLASHPSVREVAVIGVPHPRWGEAVHAVVVLHAGEVVTGAELTEFCRSRIASYKKPQSVEFVDELPRTTVGKVAKNVLRDRTLSAG